MPEKKHVLNEIKLFKFIEDIPNLYEVRYFNVFWHYWRVDLVCLDEIPEVGLPQYSINKSYFLKIIKDEITDLTIRKNPKETKF